MISLNQLVESLQNKINAAINDTPINRFHANTQYLFNIVLDQGKYRKAERNLNTVTKYINGIVTVLNDDKSGITPETLNAIISAKLDFVIPDINSEINLDMPDGSIRNVKFTDAVRDLIDTVLAASEKDYTMGSDGVIYYIGTQYSFASTGIADVRGEVGSSLTMTVFIDYTIIAEGISSSEFKIAIGKEENYIYPTRMDVMRKSVQDGVLGSDSLGISKAATTGSSLSIVIVKPKRFDALDTAFNDYTMDGKTEPFKVFLSIPISIDSNGNVDYKTKEYLMTFADSGIGTEQNLAASSNCTLIEAFNY